MTFSVMRRALPKAPDLLQKYLDAGGDLASGLGRLRGTLGAFMPMAIDDGEDQYRLIGYDVLSGSLDIRIPKALPSGYIPQYRRSAVRSNAIWTNEGHQVRYRKWDKAQRGLVSFRSVVSGFDLLSNAPYAQAWASIYQGPPVPLYGYPNPRYSSGFDFLMYGTLVLTKGSSHERISLGVSLPSVGASASTVGSVVQTSSTVTVGGISAAASVTSVGDDRQITPQATSYSDATRSFSISSSGIVNWDIIFTAPSGTYFTSLTHSVDLEGVAGSASYAYQEAKPGPWASVDPAVTSYGSIISWGMGIGQGTVSAVHSEPYPYAVPLFAPDGEFLETLPGGLDPAYIGV